jgi:pseudouridine synthase
VASRRASDRLIQTGQIEVNGRRVLHPGTRIDPDADAVCYRGKRVTPPAAYTYVVLNKPPGYLVSAGDPHHKRTVFSLLKAVRSRVFPVGRLDLDTRGVLLLTDDGDLSYRLTHPRWRVEKVYRARVKGRPSHAALQRMRDGVSLEDGPTAPAQVRQVASGRGDSVLEMVLREGRKRQVKRMCEAVGHPVLALERTDFAGITAAGLRVGGWRTLEADEVDALKRRVGLATEA